jgi:UDP-glucose:(heptosyl)LPS alpha-1,3-glucosyltransferase
MKIALLIQHADRRKGGAEGYSLDLARNLTARRHQVTVIAESGPEAVAEGARAAGFTCMYLGTTGRGRWARLRDFLRRLKDVYENHTYDIVHAMLPCWRCDVYQPHSGLATELWRFGHLKHPRPLVQRWARRFNRWNPKRRGLMRIEQSLMAHAPWLLCSSSMMREFARSHMTLPEDHLVSMFYGIDLSYFDPAHGRASRGAIREEWQVSQEQCLALLVANNWKLKGVHEAIEALAQVANRRQLVLMVVGREDPAPFLKKAQRLGVEEQVRFVGRVPDLRTLYGAADIMLLPTRRDTCSLVVLEALAMGLPVITTLQNGACDAIESGRQGILLDRGDPAALARALTTMLDREQRKAMAREALAVRSTLSHEHHIDKIEAVYRTVLERRQALESIA